MNNSLNEYLRFNFELNIELNHFLARFNVKMNNQNVSATPISDTSEMGGNEELMEQTRDSLEDLRKYVAANVHPDKLK